MTTIAACPKLLIIAADSAWSIGERLERSASKLYRYKDFIAGFSGTNTDIARCREWIRKGGMATKKDAPRGSYNALLLYRDGRMEEIDDGHRGPIVEPYYAIGDGSDFALAAMDAMHEIGLPTDPRIAVKVACRRHTHSREPIHSMRWLQPKGAKK